MAIVEELIPLCQDLLVPASDNVINLVIDFPWQVLDNVGRSIAGGGGE
jgi:hypothetical protein